MLRQNKKWWMSRTFWANVVAIICLIVRGQYGYTLSPEEEGIIFFLLNLILRKITKQPITWK